VLSLKLSGDAGVVNATPMPTASVEAMLNPDHLPAYDGPTGSVEGTVTVSGDPPVPTPADFSKCPDAEKIWGTSFREGPGRRDDVDERPRATLVDAIVGVTGYRGFYVPERNEKKRVTIRGCGYEQRTVTMTLGQELDVANESRDLWMPLLEPGITKVIRPVPPRGDPVPFYPKRPGHYLLVDNNRRYVVVDLYVFLHPLHTATDGQGHYRIDGIPVGKVSVSTKHPRFTGEATTELDVKAGVVHHVDLALKHVRAPDAGPPVVVEGGIELH
jgi:hypothetical protein